MTSLIDMLKDLDDLVGDQLQVVTYKWLARHHAIPYDSAKRVLFEFFTKHPQKVKAVFLLSGWTKGERRHTVRVVDGAQLEAAKAKFDTITAMHVYSVQPGTPKDSVDLYNADYAQSEALFRSLLACPSDNHLLSSNRLSTIRCPDAVRDPALATKTPQQKAAIASGAPAPGPKSAPAKLCTAPAAVPISISARKQQAKAAAAPAVEAGSALAAGGESQKEASKQEKNATQPAAKPKSSPGKKGGGSLQTMWGKVPPKSKGQQAKPKEMKASKPAPKAAAAKAGGPPQAPGATEAGTAPALGQSLPPTAGSDSDDDVAPAQQAKAGTARGRHVREDSDEEEGGAAQEPDAKKPKKASLMNNSDFEDEFQPSRQSSQRGGRGQTKGGTAEPAEGEKAEGTQGGAKKTKAAPKKSTAKKAGGAGGQKRKTAEAASAAPPSTDAQPGGSAEGEATAEPQEGEAAAQASQGAKQGAEPKSGRVKVRSDEPGPKRRRRVMRTYYNDAGEEVTEMVEEDASEGEEEGGGGAHAATAPAPLPPTSQHQPEQGPKPAGKASGGAAKSGGAGAKKKAAPAGQKSISAFFTKR